MPSLRNWRKKRVTKSNDKKVPALRFKGFTDDWEQRKPNNFLTESKIIGHKGNQAKKLTVKLWGKGIQEKQNAYSGSNKTQYYIRKSGQLMYGKLDFLHAAFGIVPNKLNNYESTIDSPAFDVKNANSSFLLNLFLRKNFYLYYGERANGSRKARRIHEKDFLMMPIKIPSIQEQNKIVVLIKIINKLITLQQRKLKLVYQLKKTLLEQLISEKGEPIVRFNSFRKEWERFRLENFITKTIKGKAKAEMVGNRSIYLDTSYLNGGTPSTVDAPTDVYIDDTIILWDGSLAGKVYHGFSGALGSTLKTFKPKYSGEYLFQYLQKSQEKIFKNYRTPNIPHVIKDFTTVFRINAPSLEEQNKISAIFELIDRFTSNQSITINKLKKIKRSLLQKLFI